MQRGERALKTGIYSTKRRAQYICIELEDSIYLIEMLYSSRQGKSFQCKVGKVDSASADQYKHMRNSETRRLKMQDVIY